jgi:hypothetical protein
LVVQGKKREPWLGGYVRTGKGGRRTFIIDKWIRGHHFHLSTRCNTERAALRQYERFEADPWGFTPLGEHSDAVFITPELVTEFGLWMRDVKRNSREWILGVLNFLGDWGLALRGKDLRRLNVQRDLKPPLNKWKSQRQRVEAIKSFCTWLRTEKGILNKANDATQDFRIPPATAEKTRRRKVVAEENLQRVMALLSDVTRDVMTLQLGTAWHISEVRRFAQHGEILSAPGLLAVLVTKHKSGELTRTPITEPEHLAAAKRIRERKHIPINTTLARNLRVACDSIRREQELAGVPEKDRMPHFRLGQMRHTVLTIAVARGATPEQAAQFAHHRSSATTKRFYIDLAVPVVTVPVLRLVKKPEEGTG